MTRPPLTIIYHAHCPDGFAAALVVSMANGGPGSGEPQPQADQRMIRFIPMSYGDPLPAFDYKHDHVWIVDFSLPAETLEYLCGRAEAVMWIDHHATVEPLAQTMQARMNQGEFSNLTLCFDRAHCGAVLTWKVIHGDQVPVPDFLRYIEDRDLWQWKLENSRAVSAGLRVVPRTWEMWGDMLNNWEHAYLTLWEKGHTVLQAEAAQIEMIVADRRWIDFAGQPVLAVNFPVLQSELGNYLCEKCGASVAAVWHMLANGRAKVSLRGNGKVNVAKLAEEYGGGGHPNAAGFTVDLPF